MMLRDGYVLSSTSIGCAPSFWAPRCTYPDLAIDDGTPGAKVMFVLRFDGATP
jgi:hypothetical protein